MEAGPRPAEAAEYGRTRGESTKPRATPGHRGAVRLAERDAEVLGCRHATRTTYLRFMRGGRRHGGSDRRDRGGAPGCADRPRAGSSGPGRQRLQRNPDAYLRRTREGSAGNGPARGIAAGKPLPQSAAELFDLGQRALRGRPVPAGPHALSERLHPRGRKLLAVRGAGGAADRFVHERAA